jgi:glycosyltransferase involved in cell wall biosynthesis
MLLENASYPEDARVRNEATTLVAAGYAVTVVAPRGDEQPARETVGGVRVRRFRSLESSGTVAGYLLEYALAHLQLWAHAAAELIAGASVVHLHNPPDTLFPIGTVARALGRQVVYDQHDLTPELYAAIFGESRLLALLRAAQQTSARTADLVLFTNESQRTATLARNKLKRKPTAIVRNGPLRSTLASSPGRGGVLRDPRLAYVGQLGPQDGVLELADILAALRDDFGLDRASLTVIGFGSCADALRSRAAELGLSGRLHLTGKVAPAEVPRLLSAADICIDPAPCNPLNHRSTMVKIAEYLAAMRPVVAYELRETRFTAGDAALYARCGAQGEFVQLIARLSSDPELRGALAEAARVRAPQLVWEHSAYELLRGYRVLEGLWREPGLTPSWNGGPGRRPSRFGVVRSLGGRPR